MKILVFLVLGCAVLQAESRAIIIEEDVEDNCLAELKLEENEMKGTINKEDTPEDNENYGNFYVCVWKGRGIMDDDGAIDSETFGQFLSELFERTALSEELKEKIKDSIVDGCKGVEGETDGETGIKLKNCMVKVAKEFVKSNKTVD